MNTTIIGHSTQKDSEKQLQQLAEKLYLNLHALTKYEKPSKEFLDIFASPVNFVYFFL